jgi:hypothetical protein
MDPHEGTMRRVALHTAGAASAGSPQRKRKGAAGVLGMEETGRGGSLAVLLSDGSVRLLEVGEAALKRQLRDWRLNFPGVGREEVLRAVREEAEERRLRAREKGGESVPKTGTSRPKRGKEDAKNEPHVGGNTWAGGTGGSDTAGLGGRGGPYRLDKGHVVHQVR